MADQADVLSVLVALGFVVPSVIVLLLVPFEAAAPVLPLFLVLAFVLYRYLS